MKKPAEPSITSLCQKPNKVNPILLRIFVVIIFACLLVLLCVNETVNKEKSLDYTRASIPAQRYEKQKRKGVLINTYYRSGSTFLGQYFNQRKKAFYIFEPLLPFNDYCSPPENATSAKLRYLHDLFHCRFSNQSEVFKMAGREDEFTRRAPSTNNCAPKNFCFREKSKMVCSRPFCKQGNPSTCSQCEPVDLKKATQHCLNAEIVVIKVIRLCSLKSLTNILQDPTLDIKVLHLVRDPRGVVSSRQPLEKADQTKYIYHTCGRALNNLNYVIHEADEAIVKKHKILRYEDICLEPLQYAKKIYQFTGLSMTEEMNRWIFSNTQGRLSNLKESGSLSLIKNMKQKSKKGHFEWTKDEIKSAVLSNPYSTTRISSSNWKKWISDLTFQQVLDTQTVCRNMMTEFGYLEFENPSMINSTDVIKKFCPNETVAFC